MVSLGALHGASPVGRMALSELRTKGCWRTPLLLVGLIVLAHAAGAQASRADEGTAAPASRLAAPEDLVRGSRTTWHGVYMLTAKVGWSRTTLGLSTHGAHPVLEHVVESETRVLSKGRTVETTSRTSARFDVAPPHGLRDLIEVRVRAGRSSSLELVRKADGWLARVVQGGVRREVPLGAVDYTFSDVTTPVAWLRSSPPPGATLRVRRFDTEGLRQAATDFIVRGLSSGIARGVSIKFYDLEMIEDGLRLRLRMDTEGRLLSAAAGEGRVELRIEPEGVARDIGLARDLFWGSLLRTSQPLGNPMTVRSLLLALPLDRARSLPEAPDQRVEADGERMRVAIGPRGSHSLRATPAEIAAALGETARYPIRDQAVLALAASATDGATTPWEKVERLVPFVSAFIKDDVAGASYSAQEILQLRTGDCTEHALLFAVLARAVGVPARVVTGLMYAGDELSAFGGHAWNEVAIDDLWIPVDPTWNQTTVDAARIRIATEEAGKELLLAWSGAEAEVLFVVHANHVLGKR